MDPGEFWELFDERRSDFGWLEDFKPDDIIFSPRSRTRWRASPYFVDRVWHTLRGHYSVSEASAICVAIQIEGPNVGMRAILKSRMEYEHLIFL